MTTLMDFLRGIPKWIWVVMSIYILLVCALPAILIQPGYISFYDTGQIGDTIGGVMGPFIAILAAILTFIAFWAQFEANRELIQENRRNHFENRFYKMLDIHVRNVEELNKRSCETNSDSIFHTWCNELENMFNLLKAQSDIGGFIDYVKGKFKEENEDRGFVEFLKRMQVDKEFFSEVIYEVAYSLFYDGKSSSIKYGDRKQTFYIRQYAVLITAYSMTGDRYLS